MDPRIETVLKVIHSELHQNPPVQELARRVHLSPWRLIHVFTAEMHVSPKQYVRRYRMTRAEELLSRSFLSIKEIAAALGYQGTSHFSRDFKKTFGCSPSEFREGQQKRAYGT